MPLIHTVHRCKRCHAKLETGGPIGEFLVCPTCRIATRILKSLPDQEISLPADTEEDPDRRGVYLWDLDPI